MPEQKPEMNGPAPLRTWPRAFAPLAGKINDLCAWWLGLQAGPGIKITKSRSRTLIELSNPIGAGSGSEGAAINVVGSDGKLNLVTKHSTWASPTAYPTDLRSVNTGRTVRLDADGLSVEGAAADFLHDPVAGTGGFYRGSRKFEFDLSTAPGFDIVVNAAGGLVLTHISSGRTITLAADATSVSVEKTDGDYGSLYTTGVEASDVASGGYVGLDANPGNGLAVLIGGVTITANEDGLVINNGSNNLTIDPALITHNMTVREIDVCDSGTPKSMLVIGSAPY